MANEEPCTENVGHEKQRCGQRGTNDAANEKRGAKDVGNNVQPGGQRGTHGAAKNAANDAAERRHRGHGAAVPKPPPVEAASPGATGERPRARKSKCGQVEC